MTRAEAVRIIQEHLPELRRLGLKSVALFGSIARDEARPDSDIDVLIEFEGRPTFDAFMDIKELFERVLGRRVDLVTVGALKPLVKTHVERDLIRVA